MYQCNLKVIAISDGVSYNVLSGNTFQDRLYKYHNSFKYESNANSTELRIIKTFLGNEKKRQKNPFMHWSVIDHAKPYKNVSKCCNLCVTEKHHILTSPVNLIKKRSELVSKSRHVNKFYFVKRIPPDIPQHKVIIIIIMTINNEWAK